MTQMQVNFLLEEEQFDEHENGKAVVDESDSSGEERAQHGNRETVVDGQIHWGTREVMRTQ